MVARDAQGANVGSVHQDAMRCMTFGATHRLLIIFENFRGMSALE
jgi:hypothetical protein